MPYNSNEKEKPTCPICGKPTANMYNKYQRYGLCAEHSKQFNNNEIEKCPDCGKWHRTNEICSCKIDKHNKEQVALSKKETKNNDISDQECIVCGKPSYGKKQCKECFRETKEYMDSLDKNATISENRNYYYNLKDYTFRRGSIEDVMTNCNKMIAIATNNLHGNDDSGLYDRVFKDVSDIITKKKAYFTEIQNKNNKQENNVQPIKKIEEQDDSKFYFHYSEDGHALDSEMEIKIDDVLYSSEIFHCCHKPITEITSHNKTSDWFIPIDSINKGIYIEYWGMNTPKYIADKTEKIELYKKFNIPFIEIQKDEPKNNTQLFKANLIREITNKAIEYFGKMPQWKK